MKITAANWKMHKTVKEAEAFLEVFLKKALPPAHLILFPPFTCLHFVAEKCAGTGIDVGAQNLYFEEKGAFTGEVSAAMIQEAGGKFVLVGHSERRHVFHEPNGWMKEKCARAYLTGLSPLLCIGETEEERKKGLTEKVLEEQLQVVLPFLKDVQPQEFHIAYEPVWAIGTGNPCDEREAQKQAHWIKSWLTEHHYRGRCYLLYGGSVKIENVRRFVAQPDIDGTLVGGASLDPESFYQLVQESSL